MAELLKVLNRSLVPKNLWEYAQDETGAYFQSMDYKDLIRQIESHRRANPSLGMDLEEGWRDRLDDEICRQNSIEVSHCGAPPKPEANQGMQIGAPQVRSFLHILKKVLLRLVISGELPVVTPEEAERRAQICLNCPQNGPVTGCDGCSGFLQRIADMLPQGRKTTVDDRLQYCADWKDANGIVHSGCGCALRLAVHFRKDVLDQASPPDAEYFEGCWKA